MGEQLRYTYTYTVASTGESSQISVMAESKEASKDKAREVAADYEFTDTDNIVIGKLLNVDKKIGDGYIACEGCAS